MAAMKTFSTFWLLSHFWLGMTILALAVMAISIVADRRRQKRRRIDNVGFMPWTGITVFSTLAVLLSAALAIKAG